MISSSFVFGVLWRKSLRTSWLWLGMLVWLGGITAGCSGDVQVTISGCEECTDRCLSGDGVRGKCVTCLKDSQCQDKTSPTKKCTQDNRCICGTDQDCPQGTHCAGAKGCLECLQDSHCSNPERPICALDNTCVSCKPNQVESCLPAITGACEPGTRKCKSSGIWDVCEGAKSCQAGEKCENQKCIRVCKDECKEGSKKCVTDDKTVPGKYLLCAKDQEGCLVWKTGEVACPTNQVCSAEQCVPYTCPPAECQLAKTRCFDETNYQQCVRDTKGCSVWSAKISCAANTKCRNAVNACTMCEPGEKVACYSADPKTKGEGICKEGIKTCDTTGSKFGSCVGEVVPKTEDCNGVDDNCDGKIDEGCDCINGKTRSCYTGTTGCQALGNGNFNCTGTCQPGTETCVKGKWGACTGEIKPVAKEVCDGKDDNCDGIPDDGCQCTPKATQPCGSDVGICKKGTQICDDQGRWGICGGEVPALSKELCNGLDDNCNGSIDEGFTGLGDACTEGQGECKTAGKKVCNAAKDAVICDAKPGTPGVEICDGKDNNCDGQIDEPFVAKGLGNKCSEGKGECKADGTWVCNSAQNDVICNARPGTPGTEVCNGKDDNCDGQIDENIERDCYTGTPTTTAGIGVCQKGKEACVNGSFSGVCVGEVKPTAEICNNGKDDDCDGQIDEQSGRALRFAGNYDQVEIPHYAGYNVGSAASFTLEMWINFDKLGTRQIALLLNKHRTNTNYGYHLKIQVDASKTAPQCAFVWWDGNVGQQILFGDCLAAQWSHLALVYDKSNHRLRFYKDGQIIYDQPAPTPFNIVYDTQSPEPLVFGAETGVAPQGDPSLQGEIAAVHISNTVRYTQTGQQRFTPACVFTADANTVGLWNLEDGGGTSVKDTSTQQNHGTSKGATWTLGRTCNTAPFGGCQP